MKHPPKCVKAIKAEWIPGRTTGKLRAVVHDLPIQWTMTVDHVVEGGLDGYTDRVRAWATSIDQDLRR